MPVLPKKHPMLELLHAVITSLLLSAAMGAGVDQSAEAGEDPANSETGIDVGKMPSYLAAPRSQTKSDQNDDHHQPASLGEHVAFCEPTVWGQRPLASLQNLPLAALSSTAGRSP